MKAKFGVPPDRIVDYLTLVGDTVDNVPGVDKVGPKTAVKWIAEYGSLDGVIAARRQIKGAVGENLRKALDWLPQGPRAGHRGRPIATSPGHVPGWPALDALRLGAQSTATGCWTSTTATASRAWRKELEAARGAARADRGAPQRGGPAAARDRRARSPTPRRARADGTTTRC